MAANEWNVEQMQDPARGDLIMAKTARERRSALIVPREHGAWGLLLVPLTTGAGVALRSGGRIIPLILLLVAALALFWLRTPFENLLGTSALRAQTRPERILVGTVASLLGTIAIAALAILLWEWQNPILWLIGAAAVLTFAAQAFLKKLGRSTRMLSEIIGTIGLTAAAPAAYYVVTGNFDLTAWMLWLANLAFAGNQIHYVQFRIHTARVYGLAAKLERGWSFAAGQLVMLCLLALAGWGGWLPWAALIAFVPLLARGWLYFFQKPAPLQVRRLGWSELGHAVGFCILFIAAFTII